MASTQRGEQQVIARTQLQHECDFQRPQATGDHASSGCATECRRRFAGLRTISGAKIKNAAQLLETRCRVNHTLNAGSNPSFVRDGDTMSMTGHAAGTATRHRFGRMPPAHPLSCQTHGITAASFCPLQTPAEGILASPPRGET